MKINLISTLLLGTILSFPVQGHAKTHAISFTTESYLSTLGSFNGSPLASFKNALQSTFSKGFLPNQKLGFVEGGDSKGDVGFSYAGTSNVGTLTKNNNTSASRGTVAMDIDLQQFVKSLLNDKKREFTDGSPQPNSLLQINSTPVLAPLESKENAPSLRSVSTQPQTSPEVGSIDGFENRITNNQNALNWVRTQVTEADADSTTKSRAPRLQRANSIENQEEVESTQEQSDETAFVAPGQLKDVKGQASLEADSKEKENKVLQSVESSTRAPSSQAASVHASSPKVVSTSSETATATFRNDSIASTVSGSTSSPKVVNTSPETARVSAMSMGTENIVGVSVNPNVPKAPPPPPMGKLPSPPKGFSLKNNKLGSNKSASEAGSTNSGAFGDFSASMFEEMKTKKLRKWVKEDRVESTGPGITLRKIGSKGVTSSEDFSPPTLLELLNVRKGLRKVNINETKKDSEETESLGSAITLRTRVHSLNSNNSYAKHLRNQAEHDKTNKQGFTVRHQLKKTNRLSELVPLVVETVVTQPKLKATIVPQSEVKVPVVTQPETMMPIVTQAVVDNTSPAPSKSMFEALHSNISMFQGGETLAREEILPAIEKYGAFFNYGEDLAEIETLIASASPELLTWFDLQIDKGKDYDPDDGFDDDGYEEGAFLKAAKAKIDEIEKTKAPKEPEVIVTLNVKSNVKNLAGGNFLEQLRSLGKKTKKVDEHPEEKDVVKAEVMPTPKKLNLGGATRGDLFSSINAMRKEYDEPVVVMPTPSAPQKNTTLAGGPPPPPSTGLSFEEWAKKKAEAKTISIEPKAKIEEPEEKLQDVAVLQQATNLEGNKELKDEGHGASLAEAMAKRRTAFVDINDEEDDDGDDW